MAQITPTLNIPSPFFAVSKTGEYWTPRPDVNQQYLAVSDTGTLLEITYNKGDGFFVKELSGYTITSSPPDTLKVPDPVKECPECRGNGRANRIVSHDEYGAVWELDTCMRCNGSGIVKYL